MMIRLGALTAASWPFRRLPRSCRPCRTPARAGESNSPSTIPLKPRIVSFSGTILPSWPVNTSATLKGCDRKRWILRARDTVSLSSSRQLVHAQDRDDVLQFLVALQHCLHAARRVVVLLADHERVELARWSNRADRPPGRCPARRCRATAPRSQSRCAKVVAGDGSVKSSAGTYTAWIEVIEPVLVEVMRSCSTPISSASVGW